LSFGGSSPYTSTNKQIRIYIYIKETIQKNTVQTIQNIVNISIHITKISTHYKTHIYTHAHITKQVKTTTVQVKTNTVQHIFERNNQNIIKYTVTSQSV